MIAPKTAMGVDIGGTHVTAALVNLETKKIIDGSVRRATLQPGGPVNQIIAAWCGCIKEVNTVPAVENICLAMPGPFDYVNGISLMRGQAKYESLYGLNVKELLADQLGLSPADIFMDNDAACFLQGEVFDGAAQPYAGETVIGITLGTGLGSASFRNGRSKSADKWCWPFKNSIAEEYLCTRWFVQRWQERSGEHIKGVRELAALADTDERAKEIFTDFGDHLAHFLIDFIEQESPAAVIIGGNIAKAWSRFAPITTAILDHTHPGIKIKPAMLGEHAPLLGAVSGWLEQEKSLLASR